MLFSIVFSFFFDIIIIGWCINMGEERLKEITLAIVELDDPLAVMNYVYNLKVSDIHLFLNYIKSSKYKEMNLYIAMMSFSYDYLKSINYRIPGDRTWPTTVAEAPKKLF